MGITVTAFLPILQLILTLGNICVMFYAFKTFLSKPHDTLEERVDVLEDDVKDIKRALIEGHNRGDEQKNALSVVIHSLLALIEWEMEYCITEHKTPSEGLINTKNRLQQYLSEGGIR